MLTLNDGRSELWQWDTGRTLAVDADCSQVHFSNKVFGRSIDVDVVDGVAIIPDILLQTDKELIAWAFVGTSENGYTKISKVFKENKRNKPADYVFTPPEQTTLGELIERLDKIEEAQGPDAVKNAIENYLEQNPVEVPVQSVNGKTGEVKLTSEDVGAISQDDLQEATNQVLEQAKASGEFDGADGKDGVDGKDGYTPQKNVDYFDGKDGNPGADGKDGTSPVVSVSAIEGGHRITITDTNGTKTVDVLNGTNGQDGNDGKDGINGKDGTSVTVSSVSESTADGGSNVVTFSDGKTLTVKNGKTGAAGKDGSNGADGKTPVKGTDYFTAADKVEMVNSVLAALPTWNGGSY